MVHVIIDALLGPAAGKRLDIPPQSAVRVGRSPEANLAIPDDRQMSRLHFYVALDEARCYLADLDSTNGTFVNGTRISEAFVWPGDTISAGESAFSVRFEVPLTA